MRLRVSFLRLLLSLIGLLVLFSSGCIKAHAALPSGGSYMTTTDLHAIVGDTITGRYYNGSAYVDIVYRYQGESTVYQVNQVVSSDIVATSKPFIYYTASISNLNTSPDYITFDLYPEFTLQNTEYIYSFIGHSTRYVISNSTYSPPRWEWFLNGRTTVFQDANLLNSSQDGYAQFKANVLNTQSWFSYAECSYTSNSAQSGYSVRASFFGNNPQNTAILAIGCPYISTGGFGQSGTMPITTAVSGSDVNVNVNVDMTETNSLLDSILSGIGGLVNGVKGLFVPDSEDIQDFKDDVAAILDDSFSGYTDAEEYIEQATEILVSSHPSAVISFPAIDIPGTDMHFAARTVDLNYNSDHIEFIKVLVDIIFTLAFINMIMNKHHAILVGEKVVDVEGAELNDY